MNYINKPIKINFSDYATKNIDFYKNWSVYNILKKHFPLTVSEDPDILFYFPYGKKHFSYNCHKVQCIGENERPRFWRSDFAISFDYTNDPRHLRLPNYVDWFTPEYTIEKLLAQKSDESLQNIKSKKKKFCCFVVTNPICKERNDFFAKLSEYKKVDSGGGYLNNIGYIVDNKLDFVKDYKFIIAFENSSFPGYTTEKVLEGKLVDTIPIYWGNSIINKEMNPRSFISYNEYNSFDKLMQRVIEVDKSDDLYFQYLREPLFYNHIPNEYFDEKRLVTFFEKVMQSLNKPSVSSKNFYYKAYTAKLKVSGSIYGASRSVYRKLIKRRN